MKLEQGFDSSYSYVLVAARRARQLQCGSQPLIPTRSSKACRVAQEEIAAGKVGYTKPAPIRKPEIENRIIPILADN